MGRTLQIYFFVQLLKTIFMFMLGVGALAWLIDFTELSNRTSGVEDYDALLALGMSAMRVPFILQIALPFVVLFATMTTLMMLNRKHELVVARSAGISAWQFLFPVWMAAAATGIAGVLVLNPLAASGYSYAESLEGAWRSMPAASLISQDQPWLRQDQEDGGFMLIGANRVARGDMRLFDAVFLDIGPDGAIRRRLDAVRSLLGDGAWVLSDVQINQPGERTEFKESMEIQTPLNEAVIMEALVDPEVVPFYALRGQIAAAMSYGVSAAPLRMQFHSLIALPMMLISMTLIAATVSLRFVRFGQSGTMIVGGIGAGFMLYVVTAMASSFGEAGLIPPIIAAWLPVVVATLFGVAYLLHREDG